MHVISDLGAGGAQRVVVNILRNTDQGKFEVCVVSLLGQVESDIHGLLAALGVPVVYLNKRIGPDPRAIMRFWRLARGFDPQIIHTHLHVIPYVLPTLLAKPNTVCIHTVHNIADKEALGLNRGIQKWAFRGRVLPVAIANEVSDSLRGMYGIEGGPVIPNGIPVETYSRPRQTREAWRVAHGFADKDIIFTCVASLSPRKQQALLLEAFATVCGTHPDVHLVLAGDGVSRSELERQAAGLGIAANVHFLGLCYDIPSILGASDVFVLASDFEGNPLCVMEAMSAGLPVVATKVGGVPELVDHGVSGILISPGNASELGSAMHKFMDDVDMRKAMGQAAGARAQQSFDDSKMGQRYQELYLRRLGWNDVSIERSQ